MVNTTTRTTSTTAAQRGPQKCCPKLAISLRLYPAHKILRKSNPKRKIGIPIGSDNSIRCHPNIIKIKGGRNPKIRHNIEVESCNCDCRSKVTFGQVQFELPATSSSCGTVLKFLIWHVVLEFTQREEKGSLKRSSRFV